MSLSDENTQLTGTNVQWSASIERMLARWCDQAKCFEWMHTEAYTMFNKKARVLMISSNILTTIAGLSNVITGGIDINGFELAWVFGGISVVVSITNMLQEKLAYASSAVEHKQYSILWGIIRRKIEEEVSIPPSSRKDCKTFLKYLRQDINQVSVDGSSKIPETIKQACYDKFSKIPNFDVPDICGQMEHTSVYIKSDEIIQTHSSVDLHQLTPSPLEPFLKK